MPEVEIDLSAATTLTAVWNAYREVCVPKEASDVQIAHTKKAFFAGAHAFFLLLLKLKPTNMADLTPELIATEIKRLQALHNELDKFIREG